MRLLSIGEILWDLFDDNERLGGAPLNVAINAARLGHEVAILSAVGKDERGSRALDLIGATGVSDRFIGRTDKAPTGVASVVLDDVGAPAFSISRPAAYDHPPAGSAIIDAIATWRPDWIVFGTLAQYTPAVHKLTTEVIEACPGADRLYDLNLRPGPTAAGLIRELLAQASVVKANQDEADHLAALTGSSRADEPPAETFCRALADRFGLRGVCVTRGALGAVLLLDGSYVEVRAHPVRVVDTVGAGDAFSAALVHGISAGRPAAELVDLAARVGSLIASRAGATPAWSLDEAWADDPAIQEPWQSIRRLPLDGRGNG